LAAHIPIEDNFLFLCKNCHREYDNKGNSGKKIHNQIKSRDVKISDTAKTDYEKYFLQLISSSNNLRQSLKELFSKFPDTIFWSTDLRRIWGKKFLEGNSQKVPDYLWGLEREGFLEKTSRSNYRLSKTGNLLEKGIQVKKYSTVPTSNEILCKIETNSWKYKLGWTSIQNCKNIEKLISKIESNFDCTPLAFKSWYFHKRSDNHKQFSGIICHKNRSLLCFRIKPVLFDLDDDRIIRGKRWFFSEGKEGRVEIIPQNYDLIMKCLSHAYDISGYPHLS